MAKEIVLIEGKHFSRSGLADFLNKKHNEKKSGEKFTSRDIQQYAIRGNLPKAYGAHPIKEVRYPYLGLFVEVDFKK